MITPETLAAALRVSQHGARRAMLAVRARLCVEPDSGETPPTAAQAAAEPSRGLVAQHLVALPPSTVPAPLQHL
jgi:hypothetical protein